MINLKKYLILTILALFLISGCGKELMLKEPREDGLACEPPRIMYQGECCLDVDNSGVCDMIEEALKRAEEVEVVEEAEEIADTCTISQWFECEDIQIKEDNIIGDYIKITLKASKDGITVIKKFDFPNIPCTREVSWNRDEDGIKAGESVQHTIHCDFKGKDYIETPMGLDIIFYEKVAGLPAQEEKYLQPTEITVKGSIKGST